MYIFVTKRRLRNGLPTFLEFQTSNTGWQVVWFLCFLGSSPFLWHAKVIYIVCSIGVRSFVKNGCAKKEYNAVCSVAL